MTLTEERLAELEALARNLGTSKHLIHMPMMSQIELTALIAAARHAEKLAEALNEFTDHYPSGINPYLDAAWNRARRILTAYRKGEES